MSKRLDLDTNEGHALMAALENYINGEGMLEMDDDTPVLEGILSRLESQGV